LDVTEAERCESLDLPVALPRPAIPGHNAVTYFVDPSDVPQIGMDVPA
jgi:hypothetical protein